MRRMILTVAALVLGLAVVSTADAGGRYESRGSRGSYRGNEFHNYHITHGSRMRDGRYFYKGHDHHQWTHRYWYGKYGCYTYYCPSTYCWYYWYSQDNCYYPVSYIKTATPVFERAPVDVDTKVQQIVNVTNNSPGSATAGKGSAGSGPVAPPAPPG
jgi:hypothetical protein